ncbi:MAG: hypothetical protein ACJ712_05170 [Nitrososphaeraceae archaeon]
MIFKDLKKRVNLETTAQNQSKLFERLEHKPFWIWDVQEYKREDIKCTEIAILIISLICLTMIRKSTKK